MAIADVLKILKATADPSRLRLLALLGTGEATVGELVEVLGQSQPRVSRHLKILSEARLVTHFRDGQWVYYRAEPAGVAGDLVERIVSMARRNDESMAGDRQRMEIVRRARERYAFAEPSGPKRWAEPAGERPDEQALRDALAEALAEPNGAGPLGDVLDVGAGAGALLRQLAPRARSAVGLDISRGMRVLARSRLQEAGVGRWTIRAGDMHALPFADLSFDVVVLDEVLALTDRRPAALAEAVRVLRPAGRLLILDRIRPAALRLPSQEAPRVLFENELTVILGGLGLKSGATVWLPGRTPEIALICATAMGSRLRTGTSE
jgi:DNA-binding transcriptional ArsR family regulator